MTILQINKFYYERGGAERHLFELIKVLKSQGHRVILFSMQDQKNKKTFFDKYFVKNIDFSAVSFKNIKNVFRFFYSFEAQKKLNQLIKAENPQIAHIHNISHYLTPSVFKVLRKHKIPVIMTVHDLQFLCPASNGYDGNGPCLKCAGKNYYHCFFKKCVKKSFPASFLSLVESYYLNLFKVYEKNIDIFIVPSEFIKNKLIKNGFNGNKIVVINNFINSKSRQANNSHLSKDYFIFFGRIEREKGILTLVKAFEGLNQQKLLIVGAGSLKAEVKKNLQEKKLRHIKLVSHCQWPELKKLIEESQAVIVPSEWYENAPMVILESFCLGKPVIASKIGGIPELIVDNINGLLFEPGNANDLVRQIKTILKNPGLIDKLSQNGRNAVLKKYNPGNYYKKYSQICSKLFALDKNRQNTLK